MQPILKRGMSWNAVKRRRPACRSKRPCAESRWSGLDGSFIPLENAAADLKEKVRDNRKISGVETFRNILQVEAPWQTRGRPGRSICTDGSEISGHYGRLFNGTAGTGKMGVRVQKNAMENRRRNWPGSGISISWRMEPGRRFCTAERKSTTSDPSWKSGAKRKSLKDSEWNKEDRVLLLLRQSMKQKKEENGGDLRQRRASSPE